MSYDMPVNPMKSESYTHTLSVAKKHVHKMKVGKDVEMHVKGKVKGIRESYNDKNRYEVDLENPTSNLVEMDKADKDAANMPLPALKKHISSKTEEMESGWDEPTYK